MVLFEQSSVLAGLDMDNVASLRRVMNMLMIRLAGGTQIDAERVSEVTIAESTIVERIIVATRGNTLLRDMALRFGSARWEIIDARIRSQAAEFDRLAIEAVQNPNSRPPREYELARRSFQMVADSGVFIFFPGGDEEYPPEEISQSQEQVAQNQVRKRKPKTTIKPKPKRPRGSMGVSHSDSTNEKIKEDPDETEDDDEEKERKYLARQKHKPTLDKGVICIDDPSYDRSKAILSKVDESKLHLKFKTERTLNGKKEFGTVTYDYSDASANWKNFSWNDPIDIKKLNNWRYQHFHRAFGLSADTRCRWTTSELDRFIAQLTEHLSRVEIGGRYSRIDWERMSRDFNAYFEGRKFPKGEMTAATTYRSGKPPVEKVSRGSALSRPRAFHPRKATALQNQLNNFTDERAKKLLADARDADRNVVGDDDEEDQEMEGEDEDADFEDSEQSLEENADYPEPIGAIKPELAPEDDDIQKNDPKGKGKATDDNATSKTPVDDEAAVENQDDLQLALILSRREVERQDREKKSGGESSKKGGES